MVNYNARLTSESNQWQDPAFLDEDHQCLDLSEPWVALETWWPPKLCSSFSRDGFLCIWTV